MNIKYKAYCYILILFHLVSIGYAQQSPLSSLAYKDKYRIIPAYAGLEGTLVGSATYRNQWQNLVGHPITIDLTIHSPVYIWGSAVGLWIGQDELGLERHSFIKPSFHKVFKINELLLTTGLQAEFSWLTFHAESARTPDGNYQGPNIDHKDPQLAIEQGSHGFIDLGASVYVIYKRFQGGISVEKLLQAKQQNQPFPWTNQRSLKGLAAYEFEFLGLNFYEQLIAYSDFIKVQTDVFSGFEYNGNIFGGIHLRGFSGNSLESLGLSLGFSLTKNIQLAYCHEFYIGSIPVNSVSSNQEIGLFYNFGKAFGLGKAPRIIHSPRYSD